MRKKKARPVTPQVVFMPTPFPDFVDEFYPWMKEGADRVVELLRSQDKNEQPKPGLQALGVERPEG
jgi:hypothetical protein